jgi:hypothetical protein
MQLTKLDCNRMNYTKRQIADWRAINAFIASAATVHAMETVAARNKIREQWSNE